MHALCNAANLNKERKKRIGIRVFSLNNDIDPIRRYCYAIFN